MQSVKQKKISVRVFYLNREGWADRTKAYWSSLDSNEITSIPASDFIQFWSGIPVYETELSPRDIPVTEVLDWFFQIFNGANEKVPNPLGDSDGQRKLKDLGVGHTSMSVGDIVEIDGKRFFCAGFGWKELT